MSEDGMTELAQLAAAHHEMFVTYVAAGFTPDQALRLIAYFIAATTAEGSRDDS